MAKSIVIVATLDTRGDEVRFLEEVIEKRGHTPIVIDAGVMGAPLFAGDFPRERVAEIGGKSLEELVEAAASGADRYEATRVMIEGVEKIARELLAAGKLDGIMSLGGSTGATLGASAMKALPVGVPKLIVTTFMQNAPVADADITVMQTPVDLVGLNKIVKKTLSNAAGAVMGMAEQELPQSDQKTLVGITALGVTTPAVQKVIARLEKRGYDSIVFHAKTTELDRLVKGGVIDAIVDLTSFETVPMVLYPDEFVQMLVGTPEVRRTRLDSANERGLPQIIAPGGLDMHIFPGSGIDSVPSEYQDRAWTMHGENIVLFRTSKEEMVKIALSIAERANKATGPVAIIIPLRGFSEASKKGGPLHDPEADRAFIDTLKQNLENRIKVADIDCHINDDEFADLVETTFNEMMSARR
ncbi:Tm-1-like ATP-binding domain-containing protein [Candidatus Poribacteria bacterium]|nr:Tm-1-like ATP-binding domain-containing protein [Candidatus Poribacteria bacterium]